MQARHVRLAHAILAAMAFGMVAMVSLVRPTSTPTATQTGIIGYSPASTPATSASSIGLRSPRPWASRWAPQALWPGPGPAGGVATERELDDAGGEAMSAVAASEVAASKEPGGPQGPVDATWLILQRLDDLRRAQDELRADMKALGSDLKALDAKLDSKVDALDSRIDSLRKDMTAEIHLMRNWSLGLLLLAILSIAAKMLIPGS